ncbi:MAG: hypothetical protein IIV43_07475, partial [Oscillospiraceae bacterium]|nr:hypothetical protein [Oscillospiraceae bacterium]
TFAPTEILNAFGEGEVLKGTRVEMDFISLATAQRRFLVHSVISPFSLSKILFFSNPSDLFG